MTERWRPVPGWEDRYMVSDQGRVKSLPHRGHPERIMTLQYSGRHRYAEIFLKRDGQRVHASVHVLVLLAFRGPRPTATHQGCHNNGDHQDNRLTNLRWDTQGGNHRDKRLHGTDHNVAKTHCPRSHPYSGDNLIIRGTQRYCRECHRISERARYARRKEAA